MTFAHNLFLDLETRGPKLEVGLDNYAREASILLFAYAIDDGPVQLWDRYHTARPPADLLDAMRDDNVQLIAHNAQFDRVVLMHQMGFRPPMRRWYCTAAQARAHGLPGDLDKLSKLYKLGDDAKQGARGKDLIDLFCPLDGADPDERIVEWLEFCDYAMHDISAMRALRTLMPRWSFGEFEQRVYHLDQEINDRGFAVDEALADKVIEASKLAYDSLNARIKKLTDDAIQKGTQRAKIKDWLNDNSTFTFLDMRAETLRKALRDHKAGRIELSPKQHEMIELRLLSAKSSIAKCHTLKSTVSPDGRIRYTITYGGGGRNLRFSHKGFQPGNMPRPSQARKSIEQQRAVIEALQGDYANVIWGDETMAACADAIRGLIVAAPDHKLMSVDWSNIEGRKLAWYANEDWKLQAYRDKDAGEGEDLYKIVFHRMTGTPFEDIDDFLRQQGKGADLSMGYEGGVGAYVNIANSYQLDLVELGRTAPIQLPGELMERGEKEWRWALATEEEDQDEHAPLAKGLPQSIYVACSALKHAWRDGHPKTVQLWQDLLQCAKAAVSNPGKLFNCAGGKVKMACDQRLDWLAVEIPSGRRIMFAKPRLRIKVTRDKHGKERSREELSALKAPQWYRKPLYGGLIANAITQGGCRDILVNRMLAVHEAGYPIIMHIHDDIITEVPEHDTERTLERQIEIMTDLTDMPYAAGLPLTAEGFETTRLYKG